MADEGTDEEADLERRLVAGAALHAFLSGRQLPEHLPHLPDGQIVDRLTRADAIEFLSILKELYGVSWWNEDEFKRAFLDGALAGWRPGTLVQRSPRQIRIVSTECPIAADVESDPRACDACQAFQRHAASLALFGGVKDVTFRQRMSRGDSACEVEIDLRPPGGTRS